jgi:hypothetical protein
MHFQNVDEAISRGDADLLVTREGETCVRGCYRCLLSYFNQPDHELIDRGRSEVKQFLIDLARGEVVVQPRVSSDETAVWREAFRIHRIPDPDLTPIRFGDRELDFVWRSHYVAASMHALSDESRVQAEAKGWTLFDLSGVVGASLPQTLISLFHD